MLEPGGPGRRSRSEIRADCGRRSGDGARSGARLAGVTPPDAERAARRRVVSLHAERLELLSPALPARPGPARGRVDVMADAILRIAVHPRRGDRRGARATAGAGVRAGIPGR